MTKTTYKGFCLIFYLVSFITFTLTFKDKNLSAQDLLNKRAKDFSLLDLKGNLIETSKISNKSILYLFFDPTNTFQKGILVYAQVLSNRYKGRGLEIIGITDKDKERALNLLKRVGFTFPIIFDDNKEIYSFFLIKDCCGGTVLVGREKVIKFHVSSLLNQENLRQLVEKEVLGKINYDFEEPVRQKLFKINQKAPKIILREANSGNLKDIWSFNEEYLIVSFFSSVCGMCKSGRRIETLKALDKKLKDKSAKVILVFSEPFDREDINKWESQVKMPFEKYISEDIFTDEEKYITDDSLKTDPLTILLDRERKVIFIEKLGMDEKEMLRSLEAEVK